MDPNLGLSQSSQGAAVTGEDPRQLSNSWLLLTLVFHIWEGGSVCGSLWMAQVGAGGSYGVCQAILDQQFADQVRV